MPTPPQRRRFIAGAVCPRCGAMDKLVVDMDTQRRECVACDFSEERPVDAPAREVPTAPREVPTRVTRGVARRLDTPAEAVTLIDPGKKSGA